MMSNKFEPPRFVRAFLEMYRPKSRYCLKLDESEMRLLRGKADLREDESFVMLIDDSLFCRRTKNVIFTDKRILWQEKRGAQYKSISLASLRDASVFFEPFGFGSVITVLNGNSFTQFRFKNIRGGDSLRIIFHDYLSRYCEGYVPPENENEALYKKLCMTSFKRRSIPSLVFAAAGSALVLLFVFISDNRNVPDQFLRGMLTLAITLWVVNTFLPASKSKAAKSSFIFLFATYSMLLSIHMWVTTADKIILISCAACFLKINLFESDGFQRIMSVAALTIAMLAAFAMLL